MWELCAVVWGVEDLGVVFEVERRDARGFNDGKGWWARGEYWCVVVRYLRGEFGCGQ